MRARYPDQSGVVERDGVTVAYDVYENDAPTILLLPSWAIVHSGIWKAQVAYLSRHWRVVTFDPRGNGRSDRPRRRASYHDEELVADAVAVLDASDTERALVVGLSRGARFTALLAAARPERVWGAVLIAPSIPLSPHPRFDPAHFVAEVTEPEGWQKWNAGHWLRDWPDFVRFFMHEVFVEPHSSKQLEDGIAWAMETDGETIVHTVGPVLAADDYRAILRAISCPVLVIQGTCDRISLPSWGEEIAALTTGELVLIEGAGHAPNARDPVVVNRAIHDLATRVSGRRPQIRRIRRGVGRRKRALFLSSPIGLGHVRRDLAIADELRKQVGDVEIEWLTQQPVTRVLEDAEEAIHPASGCSRTNPPTSPPGQASTTCTASRRSVRWTRSWCTTSTSSRR